MYFGNGDEIEIVEIDVRADINSPSRAEFGTPKQFPIIISEQYLQSYLMPFNMPVKNENIIIERVDTNEVREYSREPFDQNFWKIYREDKITTMAIPWLPFFSQCKGYGRHIYLYDLIELNTECQLY